MPQQLSGNTALTGSVLFLDPIVKDQARMGSSSMPGGSTPVSSASMMSGRFCQLFLVLGVLKHLYPWGGWEDPGGRVQQVGRRWVVSQDWGQGQGELQSGWESLINKALGSLTCFSGLIKKK